MAGGTASSIARRARGWPRSVRHVRIVGPPDRASLASAGARHGAAGEPPRHLPWGDAEFPGVRLGAHDVGGCGGHGERCPSRLATGGRAEGPPRGSAAVAAVPQPWRAVSVKRWECKRLSEGPASSLSASPISQAVRTGVLFCCGLGFSFSVNSNFYSCLYT